MFRPIKFIAAFMALLFAFQSGAIEGIAAGKSLAESTVPSSATFDKARFEAYLRDALLKRFLTANAANPSTDEVQDFQMQPMAPVEDVRQYEKEDVPPAAFKLEKNEPDVTTIKKSTPKRLIVKYKSAKNII
ncbi:MAG TPA: hypothetical protein VF941_03975, partial [Clostridia bacterium]